MIQGSENKSTTTRIEAKRTALNWSRGNGTFCGTPCSENVARGHIGLKTRHGNPLIDSIAAYVVVCPGRRCRGIVGELMGIVGELVKNWNLNMFKTALHL